MPYTAPMPQQAINAPPAIGDAGAVGDTFRFAMENHTHASKIRRQIVNIGAVSTYTWVYPVPFDAGVIPACNGIAQVVAGNTDLYNVQILGVPTNIQCVFQISRVSAGLLSLLLGALSINPTPGSITLHMAALQPN